MGSETVGKIIMDHVKDTQPFSRRDFLKLGGAGGLAALLACAPKTVRDIVSTQPVKLPTEFPPTSLPKEKLQVFGQYFIGESGAGNIYELKLVEEPDTGIVKKIKSKALEYLPDIDPKSPSVYWYDMLGDKSAKPFLILTVISKIDQKKYAFTGFWVDENGVTRPPEDGKIYGFYPLLEKVQTDGSKLVGIPNILNSGMQLPGLFYISENNTDVFFLPPYTDHIAKPESPHGIKVAAPVPITTPEPAPEAEEMDLEDWKKILYSATYIGRFDNQKHSTEEIFGPSYSEILTATDSDKIKKIIPENPIAILHPSGLITVITDPIRAAEIVTKEKGAFVVTTIDKTINLSGYYGEYTIMVASNAYRNGNKNIHVTFGEITSKQFDYPQPAIININYILTVTELNGKIITPIMDMPKHFKIRNTGLSKDYFSFQEAGLGEPDPTYWLDQIINAGFDRIRIYPQ